MITLSSRTRRTSGLVAVLGAMVLTILPALAAPVAAHAELVSSTPAAGASLVEAPEELRLSFTEEIDPQTAVVQLLDTQQLPITDLGAPAVDARGLVVSVTLPELAPGVYTVSYQVVSAVDGHATAGLLSFVVDPTGTEVAPTAASSSSSPSVDAATVAARWIALAALLVALGSLVMWWNAGLSVLALEARAADRRPPWLLIGVAGCIGFAALAFYLALAARPIVAAIGGGHGGHGGAGFPLDFAAPFGWTPFAIAMRVALIGSVATFALGLGRYFSLQDRTVPPGSDRRLAVVVGVLMAGALAGMSMAGHAAATGGPLFGAVDWLHLVSIAAWLGALPAAMVLSRRAAARGLTLRSMLRRHSRIALAAGAVTVLTGLVNSPLVLGTPRDLVATDYGNLLVAKALLVGLALGLGAINHLALRRLARPRMSLLIGADLTVALLAVLVGATMVTIQPAAGRQPVLVSAPQNPVHLYGSAGPSSVHAAVSLAAPGRQTYQVTVADLETSEPRDDVEKVFLIFSPPTPDLPSRRVELPPADMPGLYGTAGAFTPIEGRWTLEATVRRAGALDESTTFELPVSLPVPPELAPPPDTGVAVPAPLALIWSVLPAGPAGWLPALVAAMLVGLTAWYARRHDAPRWLPAARLACVALLGTAVLGAGSRALVTAANAPDASALQENSVPASAESIARGESLYRANCASCHGTDGSGDGPIVTLPPAGPLTDAVRRVSDGELSYRIAVGVTGTAMPPFVGTLAPEDRWDIVNHLRDRYGRQ